MFILLSILTLFINIESQMRKFSNFIFLGSQAMIITYRQLMKLTYFNEGFQDKLKLPVLVIKQSICSTKILVFHYSF